jgi:hypothetical protein
MQPRPPCAQAPYEKENGGNLDNSSNFNSEAKQTGLFLNLTIME